MRRFQDDECLAHDLTGIQHGRESFVWAVPLPDQNVICYIYLWRTGGTEKWGRFVTVGGVESLSPLVFDVVDGVDSSTSDLRDITIAGLRIEQPGPIGTTRVSFGSDDVSFVLETRPRTAPFSWHDGRSGCPDWAASDRYEVSTSTSGWLEVRNQRIEFESYGHHDHSWGGRDWRALQHWKWINVGTQDVAVHAWESYALGARQVNGYVWRDRVLAPIDTLDVEGSLGPALDWAASRLVAADTHGRVTEVDLEVRARSRVSVSHLYMTETSAQASIGGQLGTAVVEYAFPSAYVDPYDASRAVA